MQIAVLHIVLIQTDIATLAVLHGIELGCSVKIADIYVWICHTNDRNLTVLGNSLEVISCQRYLGADGSTILVCLLAVCHTSLIAFGTKHANRVDLIHWHSLLNAIFIAWIRCSPIIYNNTLRSLSRHLRVHTVSAEYQLPRIIGIIDLLYLQHRRSACLVCAIAAHILVCANAEEVIIVAFLLDSELLVRIGIVSSNSSYRPTGTRTNLVRNSIAIQQESTGTRESVHLLVVQLTQICHLLCPCSSRKAKQSKQH